MSRGLWIVAIGLIVWFAAPVEAGLRETFEAANEAFASGRYEDAIRGYEELVRLGVWDADVFYNLGTTYARTDRPGRAILNLERALMIEPGHEEASENLRVVRRRLARQRTEAGEDADLDPPRSFWMGLMSRITAGQVGIPFVLCYVGFFVILCARRVSRNEIAKIVLVVVAIVTGATVVVSGALLASKAAFDARVREAIAVGADETVLREGPGERFRQAIVAREGDRLRVLDRELGWLHLRDAQGREGWGSNADFGELSREGQEDVNHRRSGEGAR